MICNRATLALKLVLIIKIIEFHKATVFPLVCVIKTITQHIFFFFVTKTQHIFKYTKMEKSVIIERIMGSPLVSVGIFYGYV